MRKVFTSMICALLIFGLAGCTSKDVPSQESPNETKTKDNFTDLGALKAEELINKLKDGGIEIDYYISYDKSNDLNTNPTYIGKINFNDKKLSDSYDKNEPTSGTIEVFSTIQEAKNRADYVKTISIDSYGNNIILDNALIRLSKQYKKEDIDTIARVLNSEVYNYNPLIKDQQKTEEEQQKNKYEIYEYMYDNNTRWNMSYEEAKDTIKFSSKSGGFAPGNEISKNISSLEFSGHSGKHFSDSYVFLFPNNVLKTYWVRFDNKSVSESKNYIDLYNNVRQQVVAHYGEPTSEVYNWTDETYKTNEEDWYKGFKYGYLDIETQWTTQEDKEIVIRWSYSKGMNLIFCEKGYIPRL